MLCCDVCLGKRAFIFDCHLQRILYTTVDAGSWPGRVSAASRRLRSQVFGKVAQRVSAQTDAFFVGLGRPAELGDFTAATPRDAARCFRDSGCVVLSNVAGAALGEGSDCTDEGSGALVAAAMRVQPSAPGRMSAM